MHRKIVLCVLCGVLALASLTSAETLEEILAKNLEARVGEDAILIDSKDLLCAVFAPLRLYVFIVRRSRHRHFIDG
jgi:hypothetical protein